MSKSILNTLHHAVRAIFAKGKPDDGIVLGGISRFGRSPRLVHDDGTAPVLAVGHARSGKTAGLVIPTLLTWRSSAIVFDIGGHLSSATDEWREHAAGNRIIKLALDVEHPVDTYNPLLAIRVGTPHAVDDALFLAAQLVSDGSIDNDFWQSRTCSYLLPHILCAAIAGQTLAAVAGSAIAGDVSPEQFGDADVRAAISAHRANIAQLGSNALQTMRTIAFHVLTMFLSPDVAACTAESSFALDEIAGGKQPATIYVSVAAQNAVRLRPLLRLIFGQFILHQMEHAAPERNVLMMLDDFCELGRMQFIERYMARFRSQGIKSFFTVQSVDRLKHIYGQDFMSLIATEYGGVVVAIGPQNVSSAETLATAVHGRVKAAELALMPGHDALLISRERVETVQRLTYFADKPFKQRASRAAAHRV